MTADKAELLERFGYWGEHPDYPLSDWRYEVTNDHTRQGYWNWVIERQIHEEERNEK